MSQPPIAAAIPHTWHRPTGDVIDDYAWLADRSNPQVIDYLNAENDYARAWFEPHQPLMDSIFDEIRSRTQESDRSAPVASGPWWYVTATATDAAYPSFHRGPTADRATEQLLLDANIEAANDEYFALGALDVSPDHRLVAWSADRAGDEHYTMRIRTIDTGIDLDDRLDDTAAAGTAWSADSRYLFYVVADAQERPYRVLRHEIGTPQRDDVEVFRDDDQRFFTWIELSRNDRSILIHSGSKTSTEAWVIDANDPVAAPRLVRARQSDVEYRIDDWGDRWVILTNLDALDFRVMVAHRDTPDEWNELIAEVPGQRITAIEPFESFLAIHEWAEAQERVRILDRVGGERKLDIDPEPHHVDLGANEQWATDHLRLAHQSMTTPPRTIDVNVGSGSITVVKQLPTPNTDLQHYRSTRLWATADDGATVPVDIVHHVATPIDGTAPCVLYGYGAYEASMPPWFSVARLSLLDRGHVFALAHPRGGGELGRRWYLDGKLLHKRNTFTDTIAVVDHLRATGYADQVALRGGSAGGLLVGACVTMAPERFTAAVAEVPFVDIVNTMSDPDLPLTVTEWEEWGDPRTEPYASYIESYSPYDNTTPGVYPALYVSAGLNDPRVSYHEPAKWVARLRAVGGDRQPLILRTEMGAGHAGPTGRYDIWRDEAHVLAFLNATLRHGRPDQ